MNTPLNDTDKLYRFITFERLLEHLVFNQFTFVKYKCFDDPWEGFFHKSFFVVNKNDSYSVMGENRPFIMCFTKRKESDAMWRIYSKGDGVTIVTSVERLKKLVADHRSKFDCYLRDVIYDDNIKDEDFFTNNFPSASIDEKIIECLFLKRKAFDHEEEVRLVLYSKSAREEDTYPIFADPNDIIEAIILDPRIDDKKTTDLKEATLRKLGFKGLIRKSKLYAHKKVWYNT